MSVFIEVLVSAFFLGGIYFLFSLGLNITFGVMDIVNFAYGGFIMLGAYITYFFVEKWGIPLWGAILGSTLLVAFLGGLIYVAYLERLKQDALILMFSLIGLYSVITSGLLILGGSDYRQLHLISGRVRVLGASIQVAELIAFGIALVLGGATLLVMNRTRPGKAMRAVVDDRQALQLCGYNNRQLSLASFLIGSGLAGAAGAALSLFISFNSDSGMPYAVIAFAIVIVGGLGDFLGGAVASFVVALVLTSLTVYGNSALNQAVLFVFILCVLLVRSRGILGRGRA